MYILTQGTGVIVQARMMWEGWHNTDDGPCSVLPTGTRAKVVVGHETWLIARESLVLALWFRVVEGGRTVLSRHSF